jgi:hypothetical protein
MCEKIDSNNLKSKSRNTDHSEAIYLSRMAHLDLTSTGKPVCVWTEGSRKFTIRLHPDVLGRLGTESRLAVRTARRRGHEIGGILLGHVESLDDTTTFWVEGSQPVESEYPSGPSRVLSESDPARLHGALAKKGANGIGIYRSQTRSQRLTMQAPDAGLLARYFDRRDALFLLLDPVPGIAGFFVRVDGNFKCVHEFALASPLSPVALHRQSRTSPSGPGLGAVVTTLVLAAAVSGISYFRRPSAPPDLQAPKHLQLNIERTGPGLRLLWDRNSSVLRGATRAVVHIQDGDYQSARDLAPPELSAGTFTYEPRNSEVTFRLDLYSVKPSATASVIAINLSPPSAIHHVPMSTSNLALAPKHPPATLLPVPDSAAGSEAPSAGSLEKQ